MIAHVGIDDADSRIGGCTTYVASRVVKQLIDLGRGFADYPNLIRLNPNIPWKTKGNASVALRFVTDDPDGDFQSICACVATNSEVDTGNANPAVVMLLGEEIPSEVKEFSNRALIDVVSSKQALSSASRYRMKVSTWGNGMGVVGAVAAIGNRLEDDYTYELLAYRQAENWGTKRNIEEESVRRMDRETYPLTFNNYDYQTDRILITPRGPDPVLLGIRGEDPQTLLGAFSRLTIAENLDSFLIYRTNQGTDAHLSTPLTSGSLKAYTAGYIDGEVASLPKITRGGHVFFTTRNENHEVVCAVYEPTGDLRKVALKLSPGDSIRIGGGVRPRSRSHASVINIEYIQILRVKERYRLVSPSCSNCGRRMTSLGRFKGYKCRNCGNRDETLQKIPEPLVPELVKGLYLSPSRAQRHLTKPLQRFGQEKKKSTNPRPHEVWYFFSTGFRDNVARSPLLVNTSVNHPGA